MGMEKNSRQNLKYYITLNIPEKLSGGSLKVNVKKGSEKTLRDWEEFWGRYLIIRYFLRSVLC